METQKQEVNCAGVCFTPAISEPSCLYRNARPMQPTSMMLRIQPRPCGRCLAYVRIIA